MPHGKLESRITIPTGDWTFQLTDSGGGPYTITLTAADTYYWSVAGNDTFDLPVRLKVEMEVASARTYTVTIDATDGGTGKLTIAVDSGTFDLTWTSTDLRDLCGFTGNISSETTATGANQVHGLWMPECPVTSPFGVDDEGWDEDDAVSTQAPTGALVATVYNLRTVTSLDWEMVANNKTRTADESTTNESWQTYYKQSLLGQKPWATAGGPVNWHPDADVDGTYTSYGVALERRVKPDKRDARYNAWYSISLPRLVKVP